ncbi:MAG TPA: segregation and condensation protein A [Betaproteobacteria bacterium]|nr:segregation and condensation protein A [Betaproteobacteria bacterium]
MDTNTLTKEQRILVVMRKVLANIVKDTTPQPGMLHPLSEKTVEDIRHCFTLISARESELAEEAGLARNERPYFTDAHPKAKIIPLHKTDLAQKRDKES